MPSPRRVLRTAAAAFAAAVAMVLLAACEKPLPELTVLAGSTTVQVSPQTYCFDPNHCRFPTSVVGQVRARAGSTLLVDVPRAVAALPWTAVSAVQQPDGRFRTIVGAAFQSGTVLHSHTTRVQVPYDVASYFLVVTQRSTTGNGSWVAQVTVTR